MADTSDGDAECWDTVAGGGVFWTGNGLCIAVTLVTPEGFDFFDGDID